MQRLSRKDWTLIAICLAVAAGCVAIVARSFQTAFPEASIDFKVDRNSSRPIAEKLLAAQRVDVRGMKHAVRFDADSQARIFLERTLGLEQAQRVLKDKVRVWSWHHRWFQPLVEEELSVDVAPTGEIIGYTHKLPEDRAAAGQGNPLQFLQSIGVRDRVTLVATSERKLPKRVQRIYTFESETVRPAGAVYRHTVTIDGDVVTGYSQQLKVPDAWQRSYRELRSKNAAAGSVDMILNVVLMIGAVVIFIVKLRRGDLPVKFLLAIGAVTVVIVGLVSLNSMPSQLAWYDTTTSYPAFLGQLIFSGAVQSAGMAMMLIVVCGAGEVLYRERLPRQLAMPRLWTRKALASKRVFLSLVLGYALVPLFIAYQVTFYLVARKFGAWAPAEVPYDDMLNTVLPWAAVLFAGFFPALSEEFLSRAFAIPFLQRFLRSRWFAIVLAGFIWGFGHSMYPNQPFWIRGVEVGLAGIFAGVLMERFGLLPLLIWHYTIDAVYTATILFASGNTYYVVSAAVASLIFAVPLIASIVLYLRNRGFVPDDDLTNATIPVSPPPAKDESAVVVAQFPHAMQLTRTRVVVCIALVLAAAAAMLFRPASPADAIDYRITREQAKTVATWHVQRPFARIIALPVEGFRSWDRESGREDGGSPGDFDGIAATYLVHQGVSIADLTTIFRDKIEAGTWMVRFFTPMKKEEVFVEVDPRKSRMVGYHKYQDEEHPGPSLPQQAALAIASRAFQTYGLDPRQFELKESLSYLQPRRLDWLFHFDERTPLGPNAYRRVTVRVAGAEVTQFNKTIKIPESVYREAMTQTLLNTVFFVLMLVGIVSLAAIVIAGLVMASRNHGLPWRRALRWTLVLSIIPIASVAAQYESLLFGYSTSVAWETFRVSLITQFITSAGMQIGAIFLALAGLEAAIPYALSAGTAQGRARFGKSAVVAALTALAVVTIADVAARFAAHAMPWIGEVSIGAPSEVATWLPALTEGGSALMAALTVSAAIALYAFALKKWAAPITIAAVFLATLDPLATARQAPVMLLRSLIVAVVIWVVARYILGANPLAWPLFVFIGSTLQTASLLARNSRPDLLANALALTVFAAAAAVWALMSDWRRNGRIVRVASGPVEVQPLSGLPGERSASDVRGG
ncbi:MAG TPA: CPBP family intramembrane glutamic endopeptidase [Thermoanaerobaculia bacterium]